MKRKLLNISGKIDPAFVAIYNEVANVAKKQGIEIFVVGASARNIILQHGYGIKPKLATKDIDFAIQVATWDEFNGLKKDLIKTGNYQTDKKILHRMLFLKKTPIDIIPFGALVGEGHQLSWPPDHETNMNMLGYNEAYESAIRVRLRGEPVLELNLVAPAAYVALKIIAWSDRANKTNKDALDIALLMYSYMEMGNVQRLTEEHTDLIQGNDYTYQKAGARMLGRDIAQLCTGETLTFIQTLLEKETGKQKRYKLVQDMSQGQYGYDFDECLELLESLNLGVVEK